MRPTTLALLAPLAGCLVVVQEPDPHDTALPCDEMAVASVVVHVVDPNGDPLPAHEVTYAVDGGDHVPADCVVAIDDPCPTWNAGWDVAGEFTIRARYAEEATDCCWNEDVQEATVTVEKPDGACHVETEEVTITLDPAAQTCLDTACP